MTITDDDGFEYDSDLIEQMSDSEARREYGDYVEAMGGFVQ